MISESCIACSYLLGHAHASTAQIPIADGPQGALLVQRERKSQLPGGGGSGLELGLEFGDLGPDDRNLVAERGEAETQRDDLWLFGNAATEVVTHHLADPVVHRQPVRVEFLPESLPALEELVVHGQLLLDLGSEPALLARAAGGSEQGERKGEGCEDAHADRIDARAPSLVSPLSRCCDSSGACGPSVDRPPTCRDAGMAPEARRGGEMRTNAGRIKEGAALAARALSCAPLLAGVATPTDPWSRGVQVMRTFFTGAFAQGISLIAVVMGGAMYALDDGGGSKKKVGALIFDTGLMLLAPQFLNWIFGTTLT